MTDEIKQFFKAYWRTGMKAGCTENIPKEMMVSAPNSEGSYEWKLIPGVLTNEDYKNVETQFNITFPENFIAWHKRYFFEDCDCSIIRLPFSSPTKPLQEIIDNLDCCIAEQLIPLGLIPFANEGNNAGPLVFDTRNASGKEDFPIKVYDHECGGDLDGLSEIIFSSFRKMLTCLTHFLTEIEKRKRFEVFADFYEIDPEGAGATGKEYWESRIAMEKAKFEEFGY